MAYARDQLLPMPDFSLDTRQRRINRGHDARIARLAEGIEAPIEEMNLPHVVEAPTDILPAVLQAVSLVGLNFLQSAALSGLVTNAGVANTTITWEATIPGAGGNNITLTITDTGALTVGVVANAITVTVNGGVTSAAQVVAAVAADAAASALIRGVASGTGAGFPTAIAATAFTGGLGHGDFTVVPAAALTRVTRWQDTQVDAVLDLSAYTAGDVIQLTLVCDGKEAHFQVAVTAAGAMGASGHVGSGYIYQAGVVTDGELITIGGEIYEIDDDGAGDFPGGGGTNTTIQVDCLAGGLGAANAIAVLVAAINANSAIVGARDVAGADICALAPLDATVAGNYALLAPAGNTVLSGATMIGGSANPVLMSFPGQYPVDATDVARWAAGEYVPVAVFPFTTEPELYSIAWDRAGNLGSPATMDYRFAQVDGNFWVLELLDAGAVFQAADLLRIILAV